MFTIPEILLNVPKSKLILPAGKTKTINGISIDSRTVKAGELFIPIKGEKYDGARFIPEALKKGAFVLDTSQGLRALQQLAACHRSKFKIPVIGVTGSVGKTTTKDMIASILSEQMPTLKNEENFNNEIGVPLALLKLNKKHQAAVIEMAMQKLGEIDELAAIARPTIAVITNIGESHLQFLKTRRNIARAKAEIFRYLRKEDWAVINQDDEYFEHLKVKLKRQKSKVMTFGLIEKADVTPSEMKGIKLPIAGEHNIYNALAAIAVSKILKIRPAAVEKGLRHFHPSSRRMEVINKKNGTKIINDTYNASPQSMSAMLKTLAGLKGRKIAVLGDMLELGKAAKPAHRRIVRLARRLKIDKLITYGNLWPRPLKNKNLLVKNLKQFTRPHDIILVKGSRGMKMEEVVEALL